MRKNNIDGRLLTHGLRAMCAANFLLYAAVYMLLGVLPMALADDATCIYPAFLAGMLLVGPFHAYLADAFKRKHILLLSYTGVGITMAVASYIYEAHYAWLALLQGACFALASGAGTTISIDITLSGHRTSGTDSGSLGNRPLSTGVAVVCICSAVCHRHPAMYYGICIFPCSYRFEAM